MSNYNIQSIQIITTLQKMISKEFPELTKDAVQSVAFAIFYENRATLNEKSLGIENFPYTDTLYTKIINFIHENITTKNNWLDPEQENLLEKFHKDLFQMYIDRIQNNIEKYMFKHRGSGEGINRAISEVDVPSFIKQLYWESCWIWGNYHWLFVYPGDDYIYEKIFSWDGCVTIPNKGWLLKEGSLWEAH